MSVYACWIKVATDNETQNATISRLSDDNVGISASMVIPAFEREFVARDLLPESHVVITRSRLEELERLAEGATS